MAPLVGERPLRPSATLQRSASADAASVTLPRLGADDTPHPDPPPQGFMAFPFTMDRESQMTLQRTREDAPTTTLLQRGMEDAPTPTLPQRGADRGRLPLAPSRGFSVQRTAQAVDDSEADSTESPVDGGAPVVQGAWFDSVSAGLGDMTSGAVSAGGSAVGSAMGAVASSLGSHKTADTDMDELAGKLYDRIRNRLKTELLVDRERAGFLTDLR